MAVALPSVSEGYEQKLLRSTGTFLARWQNVALRVVPHGPSLSHLVIVLSRAAGPSSENLTIAVDPLWWHGPFELDDAQLSVQLIDAGESGAAGRARQEHLFRLSDQASGFTCLTEWMEVKENVLL